MTEETPALSARQAIAFGNMQVWAHSLRALAELERRGIPVIVLKSLPQIEDLYGDAAGRQTGDVDLVVPSQHARAVVDVLTGLDWELFPGERVWFDLLSSGALPATSIAGRSWHFILPRREYRSIIDLHFDAMEPWRRPVLDRAIWARAVPVEQDGVRFLTLSPEDRLLFLCWHFFADSVGNGMQWEKLEDIARVLARAEGLDRAYLARRARATGTATFLRLAGQLAGARSGLPVEPVWREVPVPARWRARLLGGVLARRTHRLGGRTRWLVWLLAHDRLTTVLPVWWTMFVPSRPLVAAETLGYWPSWPRYFRTLGTIYLRRLRGIAGLG